MIEKNELTFFWESQVINVIGSFDSITFFAEKGSKKMLNSAYLFIGVVKRFPPNEVLLCICPPKTYKSWSVKGGENLNNISFNKIKQHKKKDKYN